MKKPKVSIIIPAYNTGDTVLAMIESVLNQSFINFELIVIDDGSTDNTLNILKKIAEDDQRIQIYTKKNGGPSSARNLGLEKARGEFIQFYDADDCTIQDALQAITNIATECKSDMVVSGWQIDLQTDKGLIESYKTISPSRQTIDDKIKYHVLKSIGNDGTLYNLWNKLLRLDIIRQNNLKFREDLRFGEDVIFALEYIEYVSRIDIIPDVTYRYQVGSSTSVFGKSSLIPEYREENDQAIIKFAGDNPDPKTLALLQWIRWRWLMSYWSLVAASKNTVQEKIKLIKQFQPEELKPIRSSQVVGYKKSLITLVGSLTRSSALGSLVLGGVSSLSKKIVIAIKTVVSSVS